MFYCMNSSGNEKRSKWLMASFPPNKPVAGTRQTEFQLFSKLLLLVCHGWMLISNLSQPVCQGSVSPSLNCVIHRLSCMRHLIRFCGHAALWITGLGSVLSNVFHSDLALSEWEFHNSLTELKRVPDITFSPLIGFSYQFYKQWKQWIFGRGCRYTKNERVWADTEKVNLCFQL